jgi:hypothetical protein
MKTLYVRPEIIRPLQENIGKILEDIGIGNCFLNRTLTTQDIRARIDKWYCKKLKIFCTLMETISRIKLHPTEWEKNLCRLFMG